MENDAFTFTKELGDRDASINIEFSTAVCKVRKGTIMCGGGQ